MIILFRLARKRIVFVVAIIIVDLYSLQLHFLYFFIELAFKLR